jgi:hypothetical protein
MKKKLVEELSKEMDLYNELLQKKYEGSDTIILSEDEIRLSERKQKAFNSLREEYLKEERIK